MSFESYLQQTFPGVRVTSGKRDPNSRLGRANPRSWHNQGKAWDTAPVEGMDYEQYVNRIKQDGWDVLEARDEVRNPSKHATGPHWHVAVGNRKEPPQVNNLASLLAQQPQPQQQQPMGLAELLGQGTIQPNVAPIQAPQANLPKPGAFSKGGKGWQIMGIIGDALQTMGGGQGTYTPAMMDIREREELGRQKLAELMAQRDAKQADRAASFEDQTRLIDYRNERPGATNAARMAAEAGLIPGTPAYQQFITTVAQRPIMIGGEAYGYQQPQGATQPASATLPDGTVAYQINGKWYDNPEGR